MDNPRIHVLHIEDDDEWSGLVNIWLTARGFKVLRLKSLAEMRTYLSRCAELPHCVLLDLQLQDGSGADACDELKRSPALQHIPVVIMTGHDIPPAECLRHGALYRILKKPGVEEELAAVVSSVLDQEERSQGVLDIGDLRLDPRDRAIIHKGGARVVLDAGHFAAMKLLIHSSPEPVALLKLYGAFIQRRTYDKEDPELAIRHTARNYVSQLRNALGPLRDRIKAVRGRGYVYEAPPRGGERYI